MSWCRATRITCRCIARRRSWRGRGSRSAARSSPTGSARRRARSRPWSRRMHEILLTSSRLFADETTMPVLDPGRGQTKKGYRLGDRARRPALGRHRSTGGGVPLRAGPRRQAPEGAAGGLPGHPAVRRLRRLQDAGRGQRPASPWRSAGAMSDGSSSSWPRARPRRSPTETLRRIAALYAIEAEIRGQPPEIRQAVRQAKSKPLVEALFAWLEAQLARLPGGSPTARRSATR